MAGHWLLKTEPSTYSFAQLERDRRTVWDGVKNPMALKYLRQVERGDRLLVYHTGDEKAVVGIARALGAAYADPQRSDARLAVVDIEAISRLPRPVRLAEMKASAKFKGWELLRLPRLSVMAVPTEIWTEIERLAQT